ncbi:unnamed protein product [Paramecium sonneborni]|uniref:Response regulatory domain-containing protein n=1 Tax=Paramecium sonneborni TaxID=65129 RepID=A0A8S1RCB5_9CILI|nr:unnamed protein product [Paramecium sonneborni]
MSYVPKFNRNSGMLCLSVLDLAFGVLNQQIQTIILNSALVGIILFIVLYKHKYQKKPKLLELAVILYYCSYQLALKGVPYIWFSLISIASNKSLMKFIILLLAIITTSAQIQPICPICHLQAILEQVFLMGYLLYNRFNLSTEKKIAQKQILKQIFRKIRYCIYNENLIDINQNKFNSTDLNILSGASLFSYRLDNQELQLQIKKEFKIKCYTIKCNDQGSHVFASKPLIFDSISSFLEIFQKESKEMQKKIILASELDISTQQRQKWRIYVQQFKTLGKNYNLIAMIPQEDNLVYKSNNIINKFKLSLSKIFKHKLKTPLNTTLGFLQTIIQENLIVDEQLKMNFLKPAFINSKIQFYQVQDILEYINQEDLLQFQIIKVNLNKTLGLIYDLIELQCRAKQIKIEFTINAKPLNIREKPIYIQTDQQRLERILFNLLNKSYRHTQINGKINLDVQIDYKQNQVQFKINDNNLGFKQEQMDLINSYAQQQNKSISQFRNSIVKKSKFKFSLTLQITNKLIFFLSDMQCSLQVRNTIEEGASYNFFISMNCQQGSFQQTTDIQLLNQNYQTRNTLITTKYPVNSYPFLNYTRSQNQISRERMLDGLEIDEEPSAKKPFCLSTQTQQYSPQIPALRTQQAQQSIIQYQKNLYQKEINEKSLTLSLAYEKSINLKRIGDSVDIRQDFNQTIMLVDDEPFNHDTLKLMLKNLGFKNFISGYNGQQSIELVQKHHSSIKIIFMDLDMPIMGGIRATKVLIELMQQNEIDYIPIIACTAHDDIKTQQECIQAGMLCVIAKPVFLRSLQEAFMKVNEIKFKVSNDLAGSKVISSSIK